MRECRGLVLRRPPGPARSIEAHAAKGRRRRRVARLAHFFASLSQSERSVQGRAGAARRLCSAADCKLRRHLLRRPREAKAVSKTRLAAPVSPVVLGGVLARAPGAALAQGGCARFRRVFCPSLGLEIEAPWRLSRAMGL